MGQAQRQAQHEERDPDDSDGHARDQGTDREDEPSCTGDLQRFASPTLGRRTATRLAGDGLGVIQDHEPPTGGPVGD